MTRRSTIDIGNQRERSFLSEIARSPFYDDTGIPPVRSPDRHLDNGQLKVNGRKFDFAWIRERLLVELDGGQWKRGGGRHNTDDDRWKTAEAIACGWRVVHLSWTQVTQETPRVLELLSRLLNGKEAL